MALTRPRAAQIYDIDYKQATRVVTVANITLSGGAPNQVDGVNLSLKDRVLVTGQSTASENGIYYVTTLGSGSNGTWSRSLDTNATGELLSGTIVMVTEGLIYADTQWKITTDDPITVGVTAQTWVQNYSANSISGGNSNVVIYNNSSVSISSAGSANVLKVDAGLVTFAGNLIPSSNVTYSLGNTTNRFSNLWLSNTTIYLGNVTVGATATELTVNGSNVVVATANSDIQTAGNISATGNITGNYFLGNVFYANGITASKVYNGNSEVNVTSSGGNVNVSVGGTSNVALFTTDGEYVTGLVSVSGNIISSNVLTTGLISATGNATSGNVLTTGVVSATANVTGGNLLTAGLISATSTITSAANITAGNVLTTGLVSATGNATAGNILTVGLVSATGNIVGGNISTTGNVTGNYFLGNVACASGIYATKIFNGVSEANIGIANGNANISINGTSNVVVVTETGILVTGILSASGNVTGDNILTAGLVSAAGNAIAGNVLTAGVVSATANVTGGNLLTAGLISATSTITSAANITGANILTSGLISATGAAYTGNIYTSGGLSLTGNTITSAGATIIIDPNGSGAVDGNVVIAGNLSVQGNVTYIDSNVITTNEKSITLGNNQNTGTALDGAGIDIGNNDLAYWRFNNATTSWQSNIGITPVANATLNLGGTSNFWNVIYGTTSTTTGNVTAGNILTAGQISATANITGGNVLTVGVVSATANVTGGNVLTAGLVSATGNATAGNLLTAGQVTATGNVLGGNILTAGFVSATGNVTGNYLIGNASQVTGVNTFNQIFVTGATTVNATSLTSNVTFASGANIELTSDGNTITIAYTATTSGSIFATGGDMGLIADAVTATEDLGSVIDTPLTSYDLGGLFNTVTYNQIDMTGFTSNINTGNLNAVGLVSAAGNITGNYILGNGSQLTGISASATLSGNLSGNLLGNGYGANALTFVSATGNITGGNVLASNYYYANGAPFTSGVTVGKSLALTLIFGG